MASLRLCLLLLLVGSACAAKFRLGDPSFMSQRSELAATSSSNCSTCTNGAACCDGEQCCGGGKDCCPLNATCCGSGCCGEAQGCCPDPKHGDVCCQAEVTFCCPPDNNPSRCCPRWMICCPVGRYGCCDPTSGLPVDDLSLYHAPPRSALPSGTAAALYVNIGGGFSAMTIDMASGKRTDVSLPAFNDWSEITRTFAYDATHSVFYLLQANFLVNSTDHAITLWTVDPIAGTVTNITVSGADDEGTQDVAGFAWVAAQNAILFSVEVVSGKHSDKIDAYKFYTLSPTTGVATLVSTYTTPSGSSSPDYVGWFDGVAANGTTLYRLGYEDPTTSTNPGLAITDISTPTATTSWVDNVPVPPKLQWYTSLTVSGSAFVSLTPDDTGKYSLVKWDLSGSASVVASLPNAHRTPYFGSLAESFDGASSTYAALVVYDALVSDLDRWDLVVFNVATGKVSELALSPVLLAKFTSVSGLGF